MKTIIALLAITLCGQAWADTRAIEPYCETIVVFTVQTYDGPVVIEDVCFVSKSDAEGVLRITAREYFGDGIFRSNFDPATATMPAVPQMSR